MICGNCKQMEQVEHEENKRKLWAFAAFFPEWTKTSDI